MTIDASIAGELTRYLNFESSQPLHEQIAAAFEGIISAGRLSHGDRLPPQRVLASELGVAIGTVTRAVESLAARGLVRAEVGRGTFIWRRPLSSAAQQTGVIDLSRNVPPPLFESGEIEDRVASAVHRLVSDGNGGYGDPSGVLSHRAAYADWLGRMGTPVDPSALMLTVNAQHAIDLAFSDISADTRVMAVDEMTYPGALAAARLRGFELVPMGVDGDGTRPDELERAIRKHGAGAYYTMPTAHSPLGRHMSLSRREQIAEICLEHGILVVEDDACLSLRQQGMTSLKSLMPDNVFYISSTAKSFSPLLTSGVTIPPANRYQSTLSILVATVWSVAPLTSAIMSSLFEERADVALTEKLRARTAERLKVARRIFDPHSSDSLAFHAWLPMPLYSAERVARRCLDHGVRITPPTAMVADHVASAGIRLCLGAPTTLQDLEAGLMRVKAAMSETPEPVV